MLVRGEDASIGLPRCFAASSAPAFARFFTVPPLLRAWPISGSSDVASGSTSRSPSTLPAPLRGDRGEVEFASHPTLRLDHRPPHQAADRQA